MGGEATGSLPDHTERVVSCDLTSGGASGRRSQLAQIGPLTDEELAKVLRKMAKKPRSGWPFGANAASATA